MQAIVAGAILIVLGLITGHDALWQIGIGALGVGLIQIYFARRRK